MSDCSDRKEEAGNEVRVVKGIKYRVVQLPRVSDFLMQQGIRKIRCFEKEGLNVGKFKLAIFLLFLAALEGKLRAEKTPEMKRRKRK